MNTSWWAPVTVLLLIVGIWACLLTCLLLFGWQAGLLAVAAATLTRLEVAAAAKMRRLS